MSPDPLIGTSIGSYVVERLVGAGGMGAVYELVHPGIGKRLALKTLHRELSQKQDIVQRFFDEARAVNVIGHPNIVDVIDFNRLEDGRAYLTMEFLEGESLAERLRRCGRLPPEEVVEIALQLCSALSAAHRAGVTHRDLKPENIHLVPRPETSNYVKVLDFGIAKLTGGIARGPQTITGMILGTPVYMSPEQAEGRTAEVDQRTDVYACGAILFEMLAGRAPFEADSFAALLLKHVQEPPPRLSQVAPGLPPAWEQVIVRALAKRREHRFQTMEELRAAVEGAAQAPPIPRTGRRGAAYTPIALAGIVAITVASVLFIVRGGRGGEAPEPAAAAANAAPDATPAAAAPPTDAAPAADAAPPTDASKRISTPPQRGRGSVTVVALPWAEVRVGGRLHGTTPLTIELPAGRHQVELRNPQLGKRAVRTVQVRAGQRRTVRVRFEDP